MIRTINYPAHMDEFFGDEASEKRWHEHYCILPDVDYICYAGEGNNQIKKMSGLKLKTKWLV